MKKKHYHIIGGKQLPLPASLLNRICFLLLITTCFAISSCKKFLEIEEPKDRLVSAAVFMDDQSANSALSGIYSDMMQTVRFFSTVTSLAPGLCADEFFSPSNNATLLLYIKNEIPIDNAEIRTNWEQAYKYIYYANACIEGLENSINVTAGTKKQLIGEAKFVRAFTYFYLVNLYGDVPLVTTTDYEANADKARTPSADIYMQIKTDLTDAKNLLPPTYYTAERVRPNKWTASAMLARVYLFTGDYKNAEIESSAVINSGTYSLGTLDGTFLKSSNETIWQLMPVNPSSNTLVAARYLPANATSAPAYALTQELMNSFETGDKRRSSWVGTSTAASITYGYSNKYKIRTGGSPLNEYYVVLRLAEQVLIRAEARARLQTDLSGSISDTNLIRKRAGLTELTNTLSQAQALTAIEKERRIELFSEWGHRWLDLKRTGRVDAVLGTLKPDSWKTTASLWPIPFTQINANKKLTQNPGYPN